MALTPQQQAIALAAFHVGTGPAAIAISLGVSYDDVYNYLNAQKLEALRRYLDPIPGGVGGGGGSGAVTSVFGLVGAIPNLSGDVITTGSTVTELVAIQGTPITGTTGSGNVVLSISPALTGLPTAPTQAVGDSSTLIATDSFVTTAIVNASSATIVLHPVADGVTDNLSLIQTAINLITAGGKVVLNPVGTGSIFMSGTLTISAPNITLQGQSWSNQGGTPKGTTLLFAAGRPGIVVGLASQAADFVLRDINVRSQDAQAVAAGDYGIHCGSTSLNLENVSVRSFGDHGVFIDTSAGGSNCNHWLFKNVACITNAGDGFRFTGGADNNVGTGTNCSATSNTGWGFNLVSGTASNTFIQPHVSGNVAGGYQVATNSNMFFNVYGETGVGDTFILTAASAKNRVWFGFFGMPTTITDSGTNNEVHDFDATPTNFPRTSINAVAQPTIVFTQTVTGIVATDLAHLVVFTPVAGAVYRSTAIITCTAVGAGGGTFTVNTSTDAGNSSGTASKAVSNTVVGQSGAALGGAFTSATNKTMGWQAVLTGTIGTATYQVDFFVERIF